MSARSVALHHTPCTGDSLDVNASAFVVGGGLFGRRRSFSCCMVLPNIKKIISWDSDGKCGFIAQISL